MSRIMNKIEKRCIELKKTITLLDEELDRWERYLLVYDDLIRLSEELEIKQIKERLQEETERLELKEIQLLHFLPAGRLYQSMLHKNKKDKVTDEERQNINKMLEILKDIEQCVNNHTLNYDVIAHVLWVIGKIFDECTKDDEVQNDNL